MSFYSTGLDEANSKPGYSSIRPRFTNRLYVPVGKEARIVLLDDESVNIYEHGIWIQGDKKSMKLKVTCMSPGPDPVPHKCRICNAMIKDERITRYFVANLSCIDLGKFTIDGKTFTHTKKLVPLNNKAAKILIRRKASKGSLVGAVFTCARSEKTSPRVGDDWTLEKRVNLVKMFMKSPRIKMIQDYWAKQGKKLSPKEALKELITPFNYEEELAPTDKRISYFLGYIGFDDAPKVEDPEKDGGNDPYDYSNDDSADVDADDEDFTEFEGAGDGDEDDGEDEPPKPTTKKKKKAGKKKKKKKA